LDFHNLADLFNFSSLLVKQQLSVVVFLVYYLLAKESKPEIFTQKITKTTRLSFKIYRKPTITRNLMNTYVPASPTILAFPIVAINYTAVFPDGSTQAVAASANEGDYIQTNADGTLSLVAKDVFEARWVLAPVTPIVHVETVAPAVVEAPVSAIAPVVPVTTGFTATLIPPLTPTA
jgi:hypothetical protein